jgi:1-acyl-sn-glycerol-3-phosphate acyltransferase
MSVELAVAAARIVTMPFIRIVTEGLELLPMRGPAIVAVNHTTIVDVAPVMTALYKAGLLPSGPCGREDCGSIHGHVRFLATSEIFDKPVLGSLARHWGFIEVPWKRPGAVAFKKARDALRRGEIVGIYPEGDVSAIPDGSPRKFRLGIGQLALQTNAPIYPVAHHDARKLGSGSTAQSIRGLLTAAVRRPAVHLRVGEPIVPEEFVGMSLREVVGLVQDRVTDVWRAVSGTSLPLHVDHPEMPL